MLFLKQIEENESYYLIQVNWIEKVFRFLELNSEEQYDLSCVLQLFTRQEDYKEYLGGYPGPINNMSLISKAELLNDKEEPSTNLPLRKGLKENEHFYIVGKDVYNVLKETFGCYFELQRFPIKVDKEILLEVNYFKVKIKIITAQSVFILSRSV